MTYRLQHPNGMYHGSGLFGVPICPPYVWTDRRMARVWQWHLLQNGMRTRLVETPEPVPAEGAD